MIQCAGSTLPDPSSFAPAFLFFRNCNAFVTNITAAEFLALYYKQLIVMPDITISFGLGSLGAPGSTSARSFGRGAIFRCRLKIIYEKLKCEKAVNYALEALFVARNYSNLRMTYVIRVAERFSLGLGFRRGAERSAANMTAVDEILNYKKNPDEDYYAILGCDESSSVEQIIAEYKVLALQCHPDKNDGDKEAEAKFQKLKEAKETLCDPSKRQLYDKWRQSGISVGYKQWLSVKDHVQQSMHWSKPNTKDRMLGEASGPASLGPQPNPAARRASEASALWGRFGNANQEPPSEVISKFRNYEI
ncbi:J domain-containing protein [Eumeta japonica]|uniref:J domain-containing protein n=1 Tax=Eumeta variegata TaxID=151549 RepID=A0A4C1ZR28_EUMVA|nr:J domain-containing protein [Eumeta japonica]